MTESPSQPEGTADESATPAIKPATMKPRAPKPGSFKAPSPAIVAAHTKHPVKVPVVVELTDEQVADAAKHGVVEDGKVFVTDGDARHEVGEAKGDEPLAPFIKDYYELAASVERFHARLSSAELTVKDIDSHLKTASDALATPTVVGDLAAVRNRFTVVQGEANALREKIQAERAKAKEEAVAAREAIVVQAEALAEKPEAQVHWKNDTTELRALLDQWKETQRSGARISKDVERALWKRFTHARSSFEKARKHHFAQLDKDNSSVAGRKEELVAKAEALQTSTDWDKTARAFKDLMGEWKNSGRGRRSVDDALWKRFQAAQDAFFETRRNAGEAEEAALSENVGAKEAAVAAAEALLPVKDLNAAKSALRSIQDRFEDAGMVPRADMARLNKRMAAVERTIRDAESAQWTAKNPEIEARATGALGQLQKAIDDLEAKLEKAKADGDKRAIKDVEESLAARKAWLKQIQGVVS